VADRTSMDKAANAFASLLFPEDFPEEGKDPKESAKTGDQVEETDETSTTEPPGSEGTPDTSEDDTAEPQPERKTRKVKDAESDEVLEVEEDEAYNGYLRLQDYTRKSQANAELRRKAEAEAEEARKARELYAKQLEEAETFLNAVAPKEPDWVALRAKLNPADYAQARDQWDYVNAARKTIDENKAKVEADRQRETEAKLRAYAEQEAEKLLEVVPEWQDPAKANQGKRELVQWLQSKGYADEEIKSVVDHRLIANLRDAMLYEKSRRNAPAPVVKQKDGSRKVAPPGPPEKPRTPADARTRDLARLKKSGKLSDAAVAFQHFVG
jgi:hypothetical protein